MPLSDIEIAQKAKLQRITEIAQKLAIPEHALEPYGHYKAKVALDYVDTLRDRKDGKLILVTAISPTPAGEGKTTTTVGVGDALNKIGKKAVICLREPSLGPVFGMKGGAAGGGYAQVVPMEDINLHFTGDFNAIALANNLLAAVIDNHIHHGNELVWNSGVCLECAARVSRRVGARRTNELSCGDKHDQASDEDNACLPESTAHRASLSGCPRWENYPTRGRVLSGKIRNFRRFFPYAAAA